MADLPAAHHVALRDQQRAGLLEHPAEAFAYYRSQGAPRVVCQEKHMGSRAVVIACRDEEAARERFGVFSGELGIVITRTGRRFFNDPDLERAFLDRVRSALGAADLWAKLETSWACLDCELMPWSAKAQELLRTPVCGGRVGRVGRAAPSVGRAGAGGESPGRTPSGTSSSQIEGNYRQREQDIERFVAAYRHYCWPVSSLADLKLAPFHLLATEGHVHTDKDHIWHMETLGEFCRRGPRTLANDSIPGRGRDRPGEPGGGHRLVGGTDRPGRRGDGGQAPGLHPSGWPGPLPARREVPGT